MCVELSNLIRDDWFDMQDFVTYNWGMKTDFLFAQPSFLGGVASVVDFEGVSFYDGAASALETDEAALRSDWEMVGSDIREALVCYGKEQG